MSLSAKEVLELFGFDGDIENTTIEQINEFKENNWIGRKVAATDPDIISAATGRVTGAGLTALKRSLKEFGFELDPEEIKGKKFEEIIELGFKEKLGSKIAALEEAAKSGNDKKANEALAQLELERKKLKELEEISENRLNELNTIKQNAANEIKSYKINDKYGKVRSAIPFSEGANEFTIKGFENHIKENYQIDLDEQENIIVMDKQGNRIKNQNGTDFENLENILKKEADKAGILKKNNANTTNPPIIRTLPTTQPQDNNTGIQPNKKAIAAAEALRQQA